ncbi:MAG: CopD family protein [Hyphomonadaceae bacterium]|nr:CopD family protein [Hyphomonadaceae bacterium]
MQHFISYDFARGIHIIAVIAWISGMLMLPRFYANITALNPGDAGVATLLQSAKQIRTIILAPFMTLAWAFGLFLFFTYFASDWETPADRLAGVPVWFWGKLALALALTAYHGVLVAEGRRLATGERRRSEGFWRVMGVVPFVVAIVIVLLATVEP